MSKLRLMVLCLFLVSFGYLQAGKGHIVDVPGETAVGGKNLEGFKQTRNATYQWLVSEQPAISNDQILKITPQQDLSSIDGAGLQRLEKKLKVGVSVPASVSVDFSHLEPGALKRGGPGSFADAGDGGFVWGMGVESDGATALRIRFTNFNLPENAELYIYNEVGQAFGPYRGLGPNGKGEFWSNTVHGSIAFLQLRHHGAISKRDLDAIYFDIDEVGHIGENFKVPFYEATAEAHSKACSFNADCVEDGSCYNSNDWGAIDNVRDGVAHILFASGGGFFICSGGLLNDTDSSSQRPLFLTANHCISNNNEAGSMEAYWQFQTASCNGTCISRNDVTLTTSGASILSTSSTSDYTLMELSESAPAGSFFLGWTNQAVANSNGTNLYRISHPAGAPQAYSEQDVDTSAGTCGSWPRGNWIYSRDTVGGTEGGSSGSPVCNVSGQVVGQLSGACGFNVNDPCDSVSNATVDGALAAYYGNVADILDPGSDPPGSDISLSASGSQNRRRTTVNLSWSGANGNRVDIYRNGSFLTRTRNDGSYRDRINQVGSFSVTYEVCEQNSTTACSNEATLNF